MAEKDYPKGYSIKVAARLSGLSEYVIRVWEKRYQAITPYRKDTGHRLYSDADIERLRLLNKATDLGHRIGSIAKLEDIELKKLIDQKNEEQVSSKDGSEVNHFYQLALQSVYDLNPTELHSVLNQANYDLSQKTVLAEIIIPLVNQIGSEWESGKVSIAAEHLATEVIRKYLTSLQSTVYADTRPTIAIGTPEGQKHELGALIVAAISHQLGWKVIYFGANTPVDEIVTVVRECHPQVLAISLVYPNCDPKIAEDLKKLTVCTSKDLTIYVGGKAAPSYKNSLDQIEAIYVSDLGDFKNILEQTLNEV